jgi:hypothetical protein
VADTKTGALYLMKVGIALQRSLAATVIKVKGKEIESGNRYSPSFSLSDHGIDDD